MTEPNLLQDKPEICASPLFTLRFRITKSAFHFFVRYCYSFFPSLHQFDHLKSFTSCSASQERSVINLSSQCFHSLVIIVDIYTQGSVKVHSIKED